MKRLVSYGTGFIFMLLIANACMGITPSTTVEHLAECIKTGNYAAAAENIASDADATEMQKKNDKQAFINYLRHKKEVEFAKQGGMLDYTVIGEMVTPDESKAIVRVRYIFNNQTSSDELVTLVKAGGRWKFTLPEKSGVLQ